MADGIIGGTSWKRKLLAFVLISVILVSAGMLVFVTLSKPWTVAMQVASAIAGAALGSILSVDSSKTTAENQARTSIRRLFDQAARLANLVARVELFALELRESAQGSKQTQLYRVADRFEDISHSLRGEIEGVGTSIEDWGDLSQKVYDAELKRYKTRHERLPIDQAGGDPTK